MLLQWHCKVAYEPQYLCLLGSRFGERALATIGLYKTEVIHRRGPWQHLEAVEYATLEWVDWFNHRRRLELIGNMPPLAGRGHA